MSLKLIKEVGKKISDLTSYQLKSTSIAIQRGFAASVMGTFYNDENLRRSTTSNPNNDHKP